jgi:hypothetical protein
MKEKIWTGMREEEPWTRSIIHFGRYLVAWRRVGEALNVLLTKCFECIFVMFCWATAAMIQSVLHL